MNSQALCRCVDNILVTYDENKAKADGIPTHSLNNIQVTYIYNTTAAYTKGIMFLDSVNQKSLSHIIRKIKKKKPFATGTIINT